jgi:APA family basic amino acid/polyamine antiporter
MSTIAGVTPRVERRALLRVLSSAFGLAIAIGATIGGGILRTPGDVAAQLPSVAVFMAVWVFGAVNAFLGAGAYAELGAMLPRAGGTYVFARQAMGDSVGFFVGFTDWLNWCVAPAALILLIGEYLGTLIPAFAGHATAVGFAIFGILVLTQWRGVVWGGRVTEVTSVLKTLALIGLVVLAFVLPHPEVAAPATAPAMPSGMALLVALAIAMQGVVFTYDSYYTVVYCGEEIVDPGRSIPRSIFRGLLLISVIYLLVNAAFVRVFPIERMAGDPFVGGSLAALLFGARGDAIIRTIMIVSVIGTVNAQILAAPRILLAMSRDGLFPEQATRVNEGGTPSVAMVLTVLVISALLFSGSYAAVLGVDAIIIVLLYVVVFASVLTQRRKEPNAIRPYRAWGYPVVPVIGLVLAVVILVTMVFAAKRDALITLGLLLVSWPAAKLAKRLSGGQSS